MEKTTVEHRSVHGLHLLRKQLLKPALGGTKPKLTTKYTRTYHHEDTFLAICEERNSRCSSQLPAIKARAPFFVVTLQHSVD